MSKLLDRFQTQNRTKLAGHYLFTKSGQKKRKNVDKKVHRQKSPSQPSQTAKTSKESAKTPPSLKTAVKVKQKSPEPEGKLRTKKSIDKNVYSADFVFDFNPDRYNSKEKDAINATISRLSGKLTKSQLRILAFFLYNGFLNKNRTVGPVGYSEISKGLGITSKTVYRTVRRLIDINQIELVEPGLTKNQGSKYKIVANGQKKK